MRKRLLTRTGLVLTVSAVALLLPGVAFAQATSVAGTFASGATSLVGGLISILNFFTWFVLSILDHIMDPQYIFALDPATGTDTGLLQMLREIWQFSRDIVNLGFAVSLIIGAVMMIVTADGSKLKEHLPKYVLALVLVNFSWFIPRVIFDVSQVATYTVYQVPSLLGADGCVLPATAEDAAPRPCEVVLKYKFLAEQTATIGDDGRDTSDGSTGWRCPLRPLVCIQTVPINSADAQVRTATRVLDGLVVNHARLQWLAQIRFSEADLRLRPGATTGTLEAVQALGGIVIKLIFVLILHVAILFPLLAMAAAFFIRIPVLWVTMAFMPFVALGFVFASVGEFTKPILDNFLKAVFLPVKVAVPFAIGFIMLNAGAQLPAPAGFGDLPIIPIVLGIRDLWQLLWMGISLFILWHYGFEQLKSDKAGILGHFTEKIQGIGSSLGSLATQLPLSIPLIPLPGRRTLAGEPGGGLATIGETLRGFDPRRISRELEGLPRLGRRSGPEAPSSPVPPPSPELTKVFTAESARLEPIRTSLRAATTEGVTEAGLKSFERALEDIRTTFVATGRIDGSRPIGEVLASLGAADAEIGRSLRALLPFFEGRRAAPLVGPVGGAPPARP